MRGLVARSAHRFALVTTEDGVLLGRLRAQVLDEADPARPAAAVIEPAPSTPRPHEPAAAVRARLEDKGLANAVVIDPDALLLGTVHPADLA